MKPEFKQACALDSEEFGTISKALRLPRKVGGKQIIQETVSRLLSYIDNIIEYYLQLGHDDNTIRYPIIYIPCAEAWAEDICIEYVAYKLEAKFDANRRNKIEKELQSEINTTKIPVEEQGKATQIEREWRRFIKPIVKTFNDYDSNIRNLIICGKSQYNNVSANENLMRFFGNSPSTYIESTDAIGIEEKYGDYKDICNVFCFYSRNRECDSFGIGSLCNWKNLKNCFIIEFSSDPYCLDLIIKDGRKLCEKFVQKYLLSKDDTQNRYQDFISLTSEEVHYIFNREYKNAHTLVPISNELQDEKEYIIDLYQGSGDWRFSIKDRNVLSLCIAPKIKEAYLTYLKKDKPSLFENVWYRSVLDIVLEKMPTGIIDKIFSFIGTENRKAALVINDAPETIKTALKKFFKGNNITIKLYSYQDIKEKKIKEKKIIVLRFCPHNLSSIEFSHKKPNSFDEFDLKDGQQVLDVINELTFIDFCRYQYDYNIRLCAIANSQFRKDQLGGYLAVPNKPNISYISHYTESDDDENERLRPNDIKTVQITFEDGSSQRLPESETVIYSYQDKKDIKSIRDLKEENLLDKIDAIQSIGELSDSTVDIFFKGKTSEINQIEERLRDNYVKDGLIPTEHNHNIPIWKFLLEKKVRDLCITQGIIQGTQDESLWLLLRTKLDTEQMATIYNEMNVRVQLSTVIRDWCDLDNEKPIAPLGMHDQENMITRFLNSLNSNPGLTSLYRKKQRIKKNDTRMRNKVTEGFLGRILFADITDELAEELLQDTQYAENLAIETPGDIVALKQIALENLKLKTIKKQQR